MKVIYKNVLVLKQDDGNNFFKVIDAIHNGRLLRKFGPDIIQGNKHFLDSYGVYGDICEASWNLISMNEKETTYKSLYHDSSVYVPTLVVRFTTDNSPPIESADYFKKAGFETSLYFFSLDAKNYGECHLVERVYGEPFSNEIHNSVNRVLLCNMTPAVMKAKVGDAGNALFDIDYESLA